MRKSAHAQEVSSAHRGDSGRGLSQSWHGRWARGPQYGNRSPRTPCSPLAGVLRGVQLGGVFPVLLFRSAVPLASGRTHRPASSVCAVVAPLAVEPALSSAVASSGPTAKGCEPRYITACREEAWTLVTWPDGGDVGKLSRIPARCRSWRHEGPCAQWKGSQDWRRISDAFRRYEPSDCVFLVLTLGRSTSPAPPTDAELERWADPAQSWPALGGMHSALFKRLNRLACDEHGGCRYPELYYDGKDRLRQRMRCRGLCESHGSRWVSVVEQHRPKPPNYQAWPHLNVVVAWPWLARKLRRWKRGQVERKGKQVEDGRIPTGDILEHVVGAGFGYQSWALVAHDTDALAGYVGKIAGETIGEVSKLTQRPVAAPFGFRRLRSGRYFLPRPLKSNASGTIVARVFDHAGRPIGWRAMARATKGVRTFVADGPPEFCMGPTRWVDMRNKLVYHPSWPGWAELELDPAAFELRLLETAHRVRLVEQVAPLTEVHPPNAVKPLDRLARPNHLSAVPP